MINQVINIVREASKLMTSDITIEQKGNDSNFVTSADVNVQRFLEERLLNLIPALAAMKGTIGYRLIMIAVKLLLLPVLVSIAYEINRMVGKYDNWFTKILTAPGLWMQHITTNEPDDDMIEVGITAVMAVLPTEEGADRW